MTYMTPKKMPGFLGGKIPRFVGILEEWAPWAEQVEVALEEYGCNTVDGSEIRRSPVDIW